MQPFWLVIFSINRRWKNANRTYRWCFISPYVNNKIKILIVVCHTLHALFKDNTILLHNIFVIERCLLCERKTLSRMYGSRLSCQSTSCMLNSRTDRVTPLVNLLLTLATLISSGDLRQIACIKLLISFWTVLFAGFSWVVKSKAYCNNNSQAKDTVDKN